MNGFSRRCKRLLCATVRRAETFSRTQEGQGHTCCARLPTGYRICGWKGRGIERREGVSVSTHPGATERAVTQGSPSAMGQAEGARGSLLLVAHLRDSLSQHREPWPRP